MRFGGHWTSLSSANAK